MMVDVYVQLIKAGKRTIESVPERDGLRAAVQARLDDNAQCEGTET